MSKCYLCDQPATTVEHLPPRVFFPARKDLRVEMGDAAPDLRRNLTTVPACRDHNNAYATDDEYVAYAVAAYILNDEVADHQWSSKVLRALCRSPGLAALMSRNARPVRVGNRDTMMFEADRDRIEGVMRRVAQGILFNHQGVVLPPLAWRCHLPSLVHGDATTNEEAALALICARFDAMPWHGANRRAFQYQLHGVSGAPRLIRLRFYEAFDAILIETPGT